MGLQSVKYVTKTLCPLECTTSKKSIFSKCFNGLLSARLEVTFKGHPPKVLYVLFLQLHIHSEVYFINNLNLGAQFKK